MPAMKRTKKNEKLLEQIIGLPANMMKKKKTHKETVKDTLDFDDGSNLK